MKLLKTVILVPLAMSVFFSSRSAHAQDPFAYNQISYLTEKTGLGARAIGLGGAYLAVADDYSAIHWNPAGLGLLTDNQMFASLAHNNKAIDTEFLNVSGNNSQSVTSFDAVGFLYSVDVFRGSLVFAGGYNRIENFNSFFGYRAFNPGPSYMSVAFDEPFVPNSLTQDETVEILGNLSKFSLAGSYEAAENLFLGVSLNFWNGENIFDQLYTELDLDGLYDFEPNDFFGYANNFIVDTRIRGVGALFGALFVPAQYFRIGLTINTPRYFNLEENWQFSEDVEFDDGFISSLTDDGRFEYEVLLPFEFGIGASYDFSAGLLTGELRYTDWSQIRYQDDTPIEGISMSEANRNIKQTLESSLSPKIGLEINTAKKVKIRTGFALIPSPLVNADSDNDLKVLSFGAGVGIGRDAVIDIAYRRGWWKNVSASDFSSVVVGEDHVDHKVFTTISIKF